MGLVAVIIPVLAQREEYLEKCILSAINQSYPTEVLVVVSESTPLTNLEIIRRLEKDNPAVVSLIRERRRGFAAAINTGIEATSAERVGLLHSDDWLKPCAVEACLAHEADIVSTSMTIFDASGTRVLPIGRPSNILQFERLSRLEEKAEYLTHFFLFRRELLLKIGGVDETIGDVGPDDFDMIWTLLENNASVAIVEEALYCYRDHPHTRLTLRPTSTMISDFEKILDKHRVVGAERAQMIKFQAFWFGRTLQEVASNNRHKNSSRLKLKTFHRSWRRLVGSR